MRVALIALLVAVSSSAGSHAADPVVESILTDWQARQAKYKSVRYVLTGQSQRVDRPNDPPQPHSLTVLIDVERKRVRVEKAERGINPEGKYIERQGTYTFDGKIRHNHASREINGIHPSLPNIYQIKGNLNGVPYDFELWPFLEAHGIVPLANKAPRPDKLPLSHDPQTFQNRGDAMHADRKCTLLQSEDMNNAASIHDQLLIDRTRGGAILRHTYFSRKNPWARMDITFTQHGDSWMPSALTMTQYRNGNASWKANLKVDKIELDPIVSDDDFRFTPKPGDILSISTYPEPGLGLNPDVPATQILEYDQLGDFDLKVETGFRTATGEPLSPVGAYHHLRWLVVVPIVVMIALFALRRRRG